MKKVILLSMFLLVITFNSNMLNAQTTVEEYNYVTKGYKVQIESGLDMKKGYEFYAIDHAESGVRTADLMILVRLKGQVRETAAYAIVYTKEGNPPEYLCIPSPFSSEDIIIKYWEQLWNSVDADTASRLQLMCYLLSRKLQW
jgi:hypothetical protein